MATFLRVPSALTRSPRHTRRGLRPWIPWLIALAAVASLPPHAAPAAPGQGASPVIDALAVVLDPVTWEHIGQAAPGAPIFAHVVADSLSGWMMSACQFGLQIDPRLYVTETTFHPQVVFADEYPAGDFYLGFGEPLPTGQRPHVLMTLKLLLDPQLPADQRDDIRISLRPHTTGEPLRWAHFPNTDFWYDFVNAGGVVLNPTGADIVEFAAGPQWLVEGRTLLMEWSTYGSADVRLDGQPVAPAGVRRLQPTSASTYQLQVDPDSGGPQRGVHVEVVRKPRLVRFEMVPSSPTVGDTVTLSWEIRGADTVTLQPGDLPMGPISSVQRVVRGPAQYILVAHNEWGDELGVLEHGFLGPPTIEELSITPNGIDRGDPTTLSWRASNAERVTISPQLGEVPVFGATSIPTDASTVFTMEASNAFGTTTQQVELVVFPVRITQFVASPSEVFPGQPTELIYLHRNATELWLEPGHVVLDPDTVRVTVVPLASPSDYVLHASDGEHEVTRQATVTWLKPAIAWFTASRDLIFGGVCELNWSLSGAASARIDPDIGEVNPTSGKRTVPVGLPVTYTLTATNPHGSVSQSVVVRPDPPTVRLRLVDTFPEWGSSYRIEASTTNAHSIQLNPGPGLVTGLPASWSNRYTFRADSTATFTLVGIGQLDTVTTSLTVSPVGSLPVSFWANPASILPGGSAKLQWNATLGDSLTIAPIGLRSTELSGEVVVTPEVSTTYSLTLYYRDVSTIRTRQVTVQLPMVQLTASSTTPLEGSTYDLRLVIAGATDARLDPWPGTVPPTSATLHPTATDRVTWRLTAWTTRDTASTSLTVVPRPRAPVIQHFSASPAVVVPGDSTTLSWQVAYMDSLTIQPIGLRTQAKSGSVRVAPTQAQVYTLRAHRAHFVSQAQTSVAVSLPAIEYFRAEPTEVFAGGTTRLSWRVVPPEAEVMLVGHGAVAAEGFVDIEVAETTTFELVAWYLGQERFANVQVAVVEPPPEQDRLLLVADPLTLQATVEHPEPYEPFDVYAVLQRPASDVVAFAFRVEWPACLMPTSLELPPGGINFAALPDYIVGITPCAAGEEVLVLARWSVLPILGADVDCEDDPHVLTPVPAVVTGDFGVQDCSTLQVRPFGSVAGIAIGPIAGGSAPPSGLEAVHLAVTPLDGAARIDWEVEASVPLAEIALFRASGDAPFEWLTTLAGTSGSWVDQGLQVGATYRYRARVVVDGGSMWSDPASVVPTEHFDTRLLPAVPNPFNPSTEIRFVLGAPTSVQLNILDAAGRAVRRVSFEVGHAGPMTWPWDGTDDRGAPVGSGVYLVQLLATGTVDTQRVTLLR